MDKVKIVLDGNKVTLILPEDVEANLKKEVNLEDVLKLLEADGNDVEGQGCWCIGYCDKSVAMGVRG